MQQPPTGYGQAQQWNGQPQQPFPQQQGQLNQGPYTPYPPQQGFAPQQPYPPQQGQWQQTPTNMQWQQPYGQPPPHQPKKKGKLKWVLISLGVLLVLCIGACALIGSAFNTAANQVANGTITTPTTSTSSNTTSSSSNTNSTSNSTSAPVVGKVGQTITVDSVACTLVSVKILAPDQFTQPKPGDEFIVMHVKLKNNNSQQTDYNPFDFHTKSGAGNVTDEEFAPPSTYTANNQLNSGQLDPGGTVEGDIIFQVPVGDHKAELTWQPSIFGNTTQNVWNLGL
jgi:hypothetical protein